MRGQIMPARRLGSLSSQFTRLRSREGRLSGRRVLGSVRVVAVVVLTKNGADAFKEVVQKAFLGRSANDCSGIFLDSVGDVDLIELGASKGEQLEAGKNVRRNEVEGLSKVPVKSLELRGQELEKEWN
jgi:hypothetical protein